MSILQYMLQPPPPQATDRQLYNRVPAPAPVVAVDARLMSEADVSTLPTAKRRELCSMEALRPRV